MRKKNINPAPVRIAVFGYGTFVQHCFVPRLKTCPEVSIAGVYNRGDERRTFAEQDGFRTFRTPEEVFSDAEIDAVYIGTSNASHKELCIGAARAGKHIFCEKPLALSVSDVDEILAETQTAGVITHVNHGTPYSESFCTFKEIMQARCGQILHVWIRTSRGFGNWARGARHVVVGNPKESGGWTFHHLCHALDEACILFGTDRKAVSVYHSMQKSSPDCPSEEIVNCLITFDNGSTALLSDGTTIGGFCDRGAAGIDGDIRQLGSEITVVTMGPPAKTGRPGILERITDTVSLDLPDSTANEDKSIQTVARYFFEAIRGGENRLIPFEFVRNQYRILECLKESARTGQAVQVHRD